MFMKEKLWDVIMIVFGNLLLAVSVAYFVLPYNVLSGGVAGLAVIFQKLFSWNELVVIDVLVVGFFLLGAVILGKEFALKTFLSSIIYPILLQLLVKIPFSFDADPILVCTFGGLLAGAGIAITFQHNASTGGTDIPCLIISKYTGVSVDRLVLLTDGLAALAGLIAYGIEDVMLGIVYIYASSFAISKVMVPKSSEAVALYVITSKFQEVTDYIHITLSRGTTILDATGGYTGEPRKVILTVVSKYQYARFSAFIEKTDPYAFVIVSDAKEIRGEGFTYEYRV